MVLKVIDLFCGAGGFSEGFKQAGYEIILGVDIWEDALKSYEENHECEVLKRDIRDIDILPLCDVIIGSPPCQCFSRANRDTEKKGYKAMQEEGLILVHEFERIVARNNPKYWVWENVENIKSLYPNAFVLNSFDVGLAQRRKRAFVGNFSFFRNSYKRGVLTPLYGYTGARSDNKGVMALGHCGRSKTVTGKRIRDLETNEFLSIDSVKGLMGFPADYFLYGSITSQQKQLGNAVCPPVAKVIAEGLKDEMLSS